MYNAANNAVTTLAASIAAADTSLTVADASAFPAPPFLVTLQTGNHVEIIRVDSVSGTTFGDLQREYEDTTALATWDAGTVVENRFTAGTYHALRTDYNLDGGRSDTVYGGHDAVDGGDASGG